MEEAGVDGGGPQRESSGCVLGTGCALLVILLAALAAIFVPRRAQVLDGEQQLSAWLEVGDWPFELAVIEAVQGTAEERMVRLESPAAAGEAPLKEVATPGDASGETPGESPEAAGPPSIDWNHLPLGPAGRPPVEVLVVSFPLSMAEGQLRMLFQSGGNEFGGDGGPGQGPGRGQEGPGWIGPKGGRRTLERGDLEWGEYLAPYLHERQFEPGGTFRDWMRVNLSYGRTPIVLMARWNRGLPASKERMEELIATLAPRTDG